MRPAIRIIGITVALAALGAVLGALAGALVLLFVTLLLYGEPAELAIIGVGAVVGAVLGALAFPLVRWLLLRRVPLRRAARSVVAGTVIGGVTGWMVPVAIARVDQALLAGLESPFYPCVLGASLGFVIAALRARSRARALA